MGELGLPAVFKYKRQIPNLIASLVFVGAIWGGTIFAISHGIAFVWGALMLFLSMFNSIVAGLAIAGESDILIDAQGISRRFLGKTWQSIRWDNIRVIKTFPVGGAGFAPRIVKAYTICPAQKPHGLSYRGGKIGFWSTFNNMDQLVALMNLYIQKYKIKVEVRDELTSPIYITDHL